MDTLRLRNYRCFEDTGNINLKPVNILLGRNSSGKSSFLKFFPLLKQSRIRHSTGPFLWYAEDVDFKDFNNTVRNGEGKIIINLEFELYRYHEARQEPFECMLSLILESKDKENTWKDYLSTLNIAFKDISIEIKYSDTRKLSTVTIDGAITKFPNKDNIILSDDEFLPITLFKGKDKQYYSERYEEASELFLQGIKAVYNRAGEETDEIYPLLTEKFLYRCRYLSAEELSKELEEILGKKQVSQLNIDAILKYYYLSNINNIIRDINIYVDSFARNIFYIQPLRANAKRYYRFQNVAVDELDSHGDNLPMYLYSLGESRMSQLNGWIKKHFNFELDIKTSEGHIELGISDSRDGKSRNLVDTGFGYSQLLPIIVQIWAAHVKSHRMTRIYKRSIDTPIYIVIEQPELHLHPGLMRCFAHMLKSVISESVEKKRRTRFIIETHSEALIEEIGSIIGSEEEGLYSHPEDYQILLFNSQNNNTHITVTGYDSNGFIKQWPFGFFSEYVREN